MAPGREARRRCSALPASPYDARSFLVGIALRFATVRLTNDRRRWSGTQLTSLAPGPLDRGRIGGARRRRWDPGRYGTARRGPAAPLPGQRNERRGRLPDAAR